MKKPRILQFSLCSLLLVFFLILYIKGAEAKTVYSSEETNYIWVAKLDESGKFEMYTNDTELSNEEWEKIITKFNQNITNRSLDNINKIIKEENISFNIEKYNFFIKNDTKTLNLEIDAEWSGYLVGVQGFGYFRVAVKHEGDIVFQDSYLSSTREKKVTIPLNTYSGNWTIEVSGTGLPTSFDYGYRGSYDIKVVAFEARIYQKHDQSNEDFLTIVYLPLVIVIILISLILIIDYLYPTKK